MKKWEVTLGAIIAPMTYTSPSEPELREKLFGEGGRFQGWDEAEDGHVLIQELLPFRVVYSTHGLYTGPDGEVVWALSPGDAEDRVRARDSANKIMGTPWHDPNVVPE